MFIQAYSTNDRDYIDEYQNFTIDDKGHEALSNFVSDELEKKEIFKIVIKKFEGVFPGPK